MAEFKYPSEIIDLPSRGWFYTPENPLSSGQVELEYMTARHEDILTSRNLLQKGLVLDKLLEALIVDKTIEQDKMLVGDRNALLIASRIMAYGKNYRVDVTCPQCEEKNKVTVNLEDLEDTKIDFEHLTKGLNEFDFELPVTKAKITFKLPTVGDEKKINKEISAMEKAGVEVVPNVTLRLSELITSVNGDRSPIVIRGFASSIPTRDNQALREYTKNLIPDIDTRFEFTCSSCGFSDKVGLPIGTDFFWPGT